MNLKITEYDQGLESLPSSAQANVYKPIQIPNKFFYLDLIPTPHWSTQHKDFAIIKIFNFVLGENAPYPYGAMFL